MVETTATYCEEANEIIRWTKEDVPEEALVKRISGLIEAIVETALENQEPPEPMVDEGND